MSCLVSFMLGYGVKGTLRYNQFMGGLYFADYQTGDEGTARGMATYFKRI